MREILFKAKRIDNGEWVEGYYCQLPKPSLGATIIANGDLCAEDVADYILVIKCRQHSNFSNSYPLEVVECEYYEIDPETLCQYTGLKDKNGNRIWENDILHRAYHSEEDCIVVWDDGRFNFKTIHGQYGQDPMTLLSLCFTQISAKRLKVIGNVFDNPELLKGE